MEKLVKPLSEGRTIALCSEAGVPTPVGLLSEASLLTTHFQELPKCRRCVKCFANRDSVHLINTTAVDAFAVRTSKMRERR